jgi:three-Cys-motif partner protein
MTEFFRDLQAAAVLKHGILHRYLHIFVSKTGSTVRGGRVCYLDGYAGPGTYSSGAPGSPALAADTANKLAETRQLRGIYVEQDALTVSKLKKMLAKTEHEHNVLEGTLEEQLPNALDLVDKSSPLFAFFDPFGLGIPLAQLVSVFDHAKFEGGVRHGPATEVLLNFSYPGLRRNAGHLNAKSKDATYRKARDSIIAKLDATLGGDWWQSIWVRGKENKVHEISRGYVERVAKAASIAAWYRVPVSDRNDGPVVYDLLFLTHFPKEGIWHFNNSVSLAIEDYFKHCNRGKPELFPPEVKEQQLVATLRKNFEKILAKNGYVSISSDFGEVMKGVLGFAREKHIRKVIKDLYKEQKVEHNGMGDLQDARIVAL